MATLTIRPDSDAKADWTETPVGTAYTTIDDSVFEPSVPDTADFIRTSSNAAICKVGLANPSIPSGDVIRRVRIWVYGQVASGGSFSCALLNAADASLTSFIFSSTSAAWAQSGYALGPWSPTIANGLQLQFTNASTNQATVYAAYAVLSTGTYNKLPMRGVG